MLSKCANPECVQVFRYLHQGDLPPVAYLSLAGDDSGLECVSA